MCTRAASRAGRAAGADTRPPARTSGFAGSVRNRASNARSVPTAASCRYRLFPNQESMPQGGFGNLIALPLQKRAREQGNSVFLDEQLTPWTDQWAFLANVRRVSRSQAETIAQEAERRGRVLGVRLPPQEEDGDPWAAPPSRWRHEPPLAGELPPALELVLGNQIYIPKDVLHPGLRNRLLRSEEHTS